MISAVTVTEWGGNRIAGPRRLTAALSPATAHSYPPPLPHPIIPQHASATASVRALMEQLICEEEQEEQEEQELSSTSRESFAAEQQPDLTG